MNAIKFLLFIFFVTSSAQSQVKLISWNLENFGKSKSDSTIVFIAKTIRHYDIVAIQEVVAGYGGAQAVAQLEDELNREGAKWDYTISNPTSSSSYKTERYAYIWKTSKIKKIGEAWLEQQYNLEIDREPYYCTFQYDKKNFTLVNFYAITKNKQPETEIKYFKYLPSNYPDLNLIFLGDFNCPQSHTVFIPWRKMNYESAFINQKTSLKKSYYQNNCLASEFDNIWFNKNKIDLINAEPIFFYEAFNSLENARKISDHIPIFLEFNLK